MSGKVLVDNWTLQNAGEFLHGQHRGAITRELSVTDSSDGVHYRDVSQDTVALSCICQLIQHIVLNEILVSRIKRSRRLPQNSARAASNFELPVIHSQSSSHQLRIQPTLR